MNRLSRLCAGAVAMALLVTLVPTALATASSGRCWRYRAEERAFARKVNTARLDHRVGRLHLDRQLSKVARRHTWEMTSRNRLYHTPSPALRRRVTRWNVLGENVGVGGTVSSLHRAFMSSPGHRHNVLYGRFKHVGVGTARAHGRLWVTVIFESKQDPGTRLPMPPC